MGLVARTMALSGVVLSMGLSASALTPDPAALVGCPLPTGAQIDSSTGCLGIRPGALIQAEDWTACTANFIFASAQGLFIGTAAHCVLVMNGSIWFFDLNESVADRAPPFGRPPDARVAFMPPEWDIDAYEPRMAPYDLALIEILPHVYGDVNPRMCGWDGPRGMHATRGESVDPVYFYGHGFAFHRVQEKRQGVGPNWDGGPLFYVRTAATNGDSGGPWIDAQGRAIGHETFGTPALDTPRGTDGGVHITQFLKVAANNGFNLTLVEADDDPLAVLARLKAEAAPMPAAQERVETPFPVLGVGAALGIGVALRRRLAR